MYKVGNCLFYLILIRNTWVSQKLRYYLQEEHFDKKKKPFDFTGWVDHYDEVRSKTRHELRLFVMS